MSPMHVNDWYGYSMDTRWILVHACMKVECGAGHSHHQVSIPYIHLTHATTTPGYSTP